MNEWHVQTDEEILEWGRQTTSTDFHPAGTLKMGNTFDDAMVVVDARLRVKGVKNLRVVDGSIMPQLVSGNPNQITIIIGLKGADMILEDNGGDGTKAYSQQASDTRSAHSGMSGKEVQDEQNMQRSGQGVISPVAYSVMCLVVVLCVV